MLKYDEGKQAEWREANGRPWQVYYLRWHPARTRYRAIEAAEQARGHAPDVCLQLSGMTLQKNFGSQLRQINGVTLLTKVERFSDQGRPLHVLTCYWEPNPAALSDRPSGHAFHRQRFAQRLRMRSKSTTGAATKSASSRSAFGAWRQTQRRRRHFGTFWSERSALRSRASIPCAAVRAGLRDRPGRLSSASGPR